jgi:muramoyltetrapeptide carboxypeptidase
MRSPKPLQPGDTIGIVATARRVSPQNVAKAIDAFESWGLAVALSPMLFENSHSYLAGTDDQRITALQQFLDDPSIRAIICARGGYGTTRIIDDINMKAFQNDPKWIVGFSDVTALHLKIASLGIESIHGTMPILFSKEDSASSVDHLQKALFGEPLELRAPGHELNKPGVATGIAIGGNLSLIVDSLGTPYAPETQGKILILEEVDEYLYKVDRMMVQLKRAGKLQHLAGLVIGHFTNIQDSELPFGETVEEIIRFHTREFGYPLGFGFPIGHQNPNLSWIQGRMVSLQVSSSQSILKHQALP